MMIATFSPSMLDFRAAANSTGPAFPNEFSEPIPFSSLLSGARFAPAPASTVITAGIDAVDIPFSIKDLLVFDVATVFVDDPDLPPGARPKQKVLELADSHLGPGAIAVGAGQVLLVRVSYQAGEVAGVQSARVSATTREGEAVEIPLSLTTFVPPVQAIVETSLSSDQLSITAGQSARLTMTVRSTAGPAADVAFEKAEIFLDAKVTMQPLSVHVEPGETRTAELVFQAAPDAVLGTFDLAIAQFAPGHLPTLDVRVTIVAAPVPDRLTVATQKIRAMYQELGGRLSPLGRPRDADAPVKVEGDRFFTDYRGGTITFSDAEGVAAHATFATTVRFRGIHCFGKSEAVDEPYAIVGVYTPDSPQTTVTKKFPLGATSYDNFLASTDQSESVDVRTLTTPQDLAISCTVMEHDSGDPDRAAAAVEDALKKAAGDSGVVSAGDISVFTGVLDDLKIPGLIADVLGVGDDVIGSQTLQIHYTELEPGPPLKRFGAISFNFESPLLSDGDASYKLYFEVFTQRLDQPVRL